MTVRGMGALALGLVAGLAHAAVHAADDAGLSSLEAGEYSIVVTGTIGAKAVALSATDGDAAVSDDQLRAREVSERARFTGDTFYKPESGADGPFELTMAVGPEYVTIDGLEQPALSLRLHFGEGIAPGTYDVTEGFLDAGPNGAPVSVLVGATSADRKTTFAFGWKVNGTLTLEQIDRQGATGHFRFRANRMNREGQVTDETVTAEGAFRRIPYVPEAELPGG